MKIEQHIKLIAILNISLGSILVFVGVMAFAFFAGIGVVSGDLSAIPILGLVGSIGFVFMLGFGLPGILGGIGLLQRKEWARILVIAASCVGLFAFPIGTALSIYTFWVLFNDETIKLFESARSAQALGGNSASS
jgi:hypothetical protein